jgi:hypothetical protein
MSTSKDPLSDLLASLNRVSASLPERVDGLFADELRQHQYLETGRLYAEQERKIFEAVNALRNCRDKTRQD